MARTRKSVFGMVLTAFLMLAGGTVWAEPAPPVVVARAAELVDATTGQILFASHAEQELPMASVTKLMTLYIAIRAITHHKLSLHAMVPADLEAYHIGGSQIWLRPGEKLSVEQMLRAIAVGSANDAAYALGTYIGGSETQFVAMMNQTAKELGMHHTHFTNPHGLPAADHYTTAHDLALLGAAAVKYPLLLHYTSQWQDRSIRNGKGGHLWLINQNRLLRTFVGADGLKTGYTHSAGFCMVASAHREHTRLIAVILGAPSSKSRFQDASGLLSWGFQNYRTLYIDKPAGLPHVLPVFRGAKLEVGVALSRPLALTISTGETDRVTSRVEMARHLVAPVRYHQTVGQVIVNVPHQRPVRIPVWSTQAIRRQRLGEVVLNYFWHIIG
ncbi:MAG: D-alanyl-D-alanine carboxypeptidase [Firmicutes bacterium]|nr:D-alanyl-D-alanine carboxypeptidase [Bacillota bacterium]